MWETILNLQQSIELTIEKNTIIFLYQKYLKTSEALFYFLKIAFLDIVQKQLSINSTKKFSLVFWKQILVLWSELPFYRHNKPNTFFTQNDF